MIDSQLSRVVLALCDRGKAAGLELTPKSVVLRPSEGGICACTHHFRTQPLAAFALSRRYRRLMRTRCMASADLADVAGKLHEVNLGRMTMQTMIFEPQPLVLHLAIGPCPTSARPLRRLELAGLLGAASSKRADRTAGGM